MNRNTSVNETRLLWLLILVLGGVAVYRNRDRGILAYPTALMVQSRLSTMLTDRGIKQPSVLILFRAENCASVLSILAALKAKEAADEMRLVAIAIGEDAKELDEILGAEGISMRVELLSSKSAEAFLMRQRIKRLPALFVQSASGSLRRVGLGELGVDTE